MGAKPLDIHPAALDELKSAVAWYQERNETAALNFVTELDRAIDLVTASPRRVRTLTLALLLGVRILRCEKQQAHSVQG